MKISLLSCAAVILVGISACADPAAPPPAVPSSSPLSVDAPDHVGGDGGSGINVNIDVTSPSPTVYPDPVGDNASGIDVNVR